MEQPIKQFSLKSQAEVSLAQMATRRIRSSLPLGVRVYCGVFQKSGRRALAEVLSLAQCDCFVGYLEPVRCMPMLFRMISPV